MTRGTKFWFKLLPASFVAIAAMTYGVFRFSIYRLADRFERKYPHDGQNSLGAFVGALVLAVATAAVATVVLLGWGLFRSDRIANEEHPDVVQKIR